MHISSVSIDLLSVVHRWTDVQARDGSAILVLKVFSGPVLKVGAIAFALFETIACWLLLLPAVLVKPLLPPQTCAKLTQRGRSAARSASDAFRSLSCVRVAQAQNSQPSARLFPGHMPRQVPPGKLSTFVSSHTCALRAARMVGLAAPAFTCGRYFETIRAMLSNWCGKPETPTRGQLMMQIWHGERDLWQLYPGTAGLMFVVEIGMALGGVEVYGMLKSR